MKEEEQKRVNRNNPIIAHINESVITMRGYVPVDVSQQSEASLHQAGLNMQLARRLFTKRCLWLIRMHPDDISRLHEADLLNRYSQKRNN